MTVVNNTVQILNLLDTTVGETGPIQNINKSFLQADVPIRFHVDLAAGDTVQIQGRLGNSPAEWAVLHTFTDEVPIDVYLSDEIRVIRTVDGGGESTVTVQNQFQPPLQFTAHTV